MVSVDEEKPKDKNLTLLSLQAENATKKKRKVPWKSVVWGGIHQSFFDERLEMISSLDFLQFTIHKRDSAKSTTQKHDPEISTGSCFYLAGILNWQFLK